MPGTVPTATRSQNESGNLSGTLFMRDGCVGGAQKRHQLGNYKSYVIVLSEL